MHDEMAVVRRYMRNPPVDVEGLIEELKIVYIEEPMESGQSGRIDFNDPFCTITVNSLESPQRRRFTAAHELGHYLLHRDMLDQTGHLDRLFDREKYDNPTSPLSMKHETQANRFAADLLMPSSVITERYDSATDNVGELARQFGVSASAMVIRLKNLGLRDTIVKSAKAMP